MRTSFLLVVGLVAARSARAQSFNIDVHDAAGTPGSTFAAAALQPGVWNAVPGAVGTTPLVDLAGQATPVTITAANTSASTFDNAGTTGDDQALMDDYSAPPTGGTAVWTIAGLQPGTYVLYTYGWTPSTASLESIVEVLGSIDGVQFVAGAWPNGYVLGDTHARHRISVQAGSTISVSVHGLFGGGRVNGFQVVPEPNGFFRHCLPGTASTIACPCGQPPNFLGGCSNFGAGPTSGGLLDAIGVPSLGSDTFVLVTSNQQWFPHANILNVFYTSTGTSIPNGVAHGSGVRCYDQNLRRLYSGQTDPTGSLSKPAAGDPSVSARSAQLGSPITPGQTRYYFNVYRDPAAAGPCGNTASTVNTTNAGSIQWVP